MSKTIRANSNNSFLQRFLLISIVCMGFGSWFIYDATVKYPDNARRSKAYQEIQDMDLAENEKTQKWEALAKENGWSHAEPEYTEAEWKSKIKWEQYPMAIASFLVGIPVLINYFRSRNSWIETDGENLTTSWGKSFSLKSVTEINKRKWQSKGIAKLKYTDGDSSRTFVMDDFKYSQQEMGEIMSVAESFVKAENILHGPTQAEIEAEKEAEAEYDEVDDKDED